MDHRTMTPRERYLSSLEMLAGTSSHANVEERIAFTSQIAKPT
jgi:hypothetical protein